MLLFALAGGVQHVVVMDTAATHHRAMGCAAVEALCPAGAQGGAAAGTAPCAVWLHEVLDAGARALGPLGAGYAEGAGAEGAEGKRGAVATTDARPSKLRRVGAGAGAQAAAKGEETGTQGGAGRCWPASTDLGSASLAPLSAWAPQRPFWQLSDRAAAALGPELGEHELLTVVPTSGSTGVPKARPNASWSLRRPLLTPSVNGR